MAGNKTGPKPRFTREQAVTAALRLRLDQFTMAQVAQALGVATSALYRVFASREELLTACLDRILDDIGLEQLGATGDADAPGKAWPNILRDFVDTCWDACERYPGLAQVVMLDPKAPSRATSQMQTLISHLSRQGISAGQALFALDFLGDIVFATHVALEPYRKLGAEALRDYTASGFPFEFQENWAERGNLDEKVRFIIAALANDWPELR